MAAAPQRQASDIILEVLPISEYVVAGDSGCYGSLVKAFNVCYTWGFRFIVWLVLVAIIVFSFPLGMFASLVHFMSNLFRLLATSWGKLWSDACGYGTWARTRAAYFAMKRAAVQGTAAAAVSGIAPIRSASSGRSIPLLVAAELGMAEDSGVVKSFNSLFSAGFATGAVVLVLFAFIFSPALGMFVSAWTIFADLWRSFARTSGRLILEMLGLGEMVDEHTAFMQAKITAAGSAPGSGSVSGGAPAAIVAGAAAYPAAPAAFFAPSAIAVPVALPAGFGGFSAPVYSGQHPNQQALMAQQYGAPANSGSYQSQDPVMHQQPQAQSMYPSKVL